MHKQGPDMHKRVIRFQTASSRYARLVLLAPAPHVSAVGSSLSLCIAVLATAFSGLPRKLRGTAAGCTACTARREAAMTPP
jgi:hypothetical protein